MHAKIPALPPPLSQVLLVLETILDRVVPSYQPQSYVECNIIEFIIA